MQAVRIRVRAESYDELGVFAQRAQALTNASGTAIALIEGNADEIICRARAGSSAPEVGTVSRVEGTFTGLCIQSGQELRCDNAETDTRVDKAAILALGIRSMVAVPINEEGRVVGVLAVFAPTANAFGVPHVVVLKTIADQIADYLHRALGAEAYSPQPLPAPSMIVAGANPGEPALTHRHLPEVPKAEPVQAATSADEIDPAPLSQKRETNRHDEQTDSKTDFRRVLGALFRRVLGTLDAARKNRPGTNVLMIGAAAVVVIAVAVGLSFKLRRPGAAPQPPLEASSSLRAPGLPSAIDQPPAKNIPFASATKHDEAQAKRAEARPKREETIVLPVGQSRISLPQPATSALVGDPALPQPATSARVGDPAEARDNSAPTSDPPAISLDVPASKSLSNLVSPVSQPPDPRLLTQSEFEPVTAIKKVAPVYPLAAKQQRLTGSVVVQGTVNKNGRISDLQLISGSPLFRDAAFAAVKQWVFKPARLNGKSIEQPTRIRLDFGAR